MFHDGSGSRSSHTRPRPHITFPFRPPRRLTRRQLLFSVLLCVVILSGVIGGWSTGVFTSHAAGPLPSAPASMTFQQFLQQGSAGPGRSGPFVFPRTGPQMPFSSKEQLTDFSHLPPSAQPVTMQPIQQTLDAPFLAGSAGVQPLDLASSDHRLEVQVTPGSLDLSDPWTFCWRSEPARFLPAPGDRCAGAPSPGHSPAHAGDLHLSLPARRTDRFEFEPRSPVADLARSGVCCTAGSSTRHGFSHRLAQ
jgi:hypothetical protein